MCSHLPAPVTSDVVDEDPLLPESENSNGLDLKSVLGSRAMSDSLTILVHSMPSRAGSMSCRDLMHLNSGRTVGQNSVQDLPGGPRLMAEIQKKEAQGWQLLNFAPPDINLNIDSRTNIK